MWLAQTCVLGFDRMGIWGATADGVPITAINAVHAIAPEDDPTAACGGAAAARGGVGALPGMLGGMAGGSMVNPPKLGAAGDGGGLIVTAGDRGEVRLLRSPCLVAAAPAREGHAHVGKVACVRFGNEGRRVLSVGLQDKLLVVWNVEEVRRF